jgi:hypothetical protein
MRSLTLSAETQAIFNRISSYAWALNVYGMSQSRALWLVKARTQTRINQSFGDTLTPRPSRTDTVFREALGHPTIGIAD